MWTFQNSKLQDICIFKDMVMGQNMSSRTLACIISEGHNGDGTEHKFKDTWICNKQNTTVTEPIYKSRTYACLISSSSCNAYATLLHTSTTREPGIASPQTMEEAPAGNYFTQSPAATDIETASSPWAEEAPTCFPRGLHAVQQQSHQQSSSQNRPPQPPGSKTKCRWNLYRYEHSISWTFRMSIFITIEM